MRTIQFTQYMAPHGTKQITFIRRPNEICDIADKLISAGCHFDIEVLRTTEVSMTVENDDYTIAHRICKNDESVPIHVDELIIEAADKLQLISRAKLSLLPQTLTEDDATRLQEIVDNKLAKPTIEPHRLPQIDKQ